MLNNNYDSLLAKISRHTFKGTSGTTISLAASEKSIVYLTNDSSI